MRLNLQTKIILCSTLLTLFSCKTVIAETIINNYGTFNNQPQQDQQQPPSQCNSNSASTDPRVPPAGTYHIQHGDGSSEEVYTTGEKKPYYVDNNCNQNAVVPQVYIQPNVISPNHGAIKR